MKTRRETNGHDPEWDAWTTRAGRRLARGPFTLAEAKAAFDNALPVEMAAADLDAICQAGIAVYGDEFEQETPSEARRASSRTLARHQLSHERLDRRDALAPLTLFFCTADLSGLLEEPPAAVEVPIADLSWDSDLHFVDRTAWRGAAGWTPHDESSLDTGLAPARFEWQDTFEADSAFALVGAPSVLAPATTDISHDAVFTDDAWREGV